MDSRLADALLDQGDVEGCSAWFSIPKAITESERKAAAADSIN